MTQQESAYHPRLQEGPPIQDRTQGWYHHCTCWNLLFPQQLQQGLTRRNRGNTYGFCFRAIFCTNMFTPAQLGVGNCVTCHNGFPSLPRMAFESSAIRFTVCGPHSPWTLAQVSPSSHESDMFIFREGLCTGFSSEGIYCTWKSMFNDSVKL